MTTINLKDFYYWYTQDQFKHQRRRWAGPTHGHDPPLDRLAACPSGPPFPVVRGCRAEYGCLWTGQGNGRGTP